MSEVREQLLPIEEKYKRFKQQQLTFIRALERSREHARNNKTMPVSTVEEVQRYMSHHCSNDTDRRIFLFFLEIISDLGGLLKHLESSQSSQNTSCESLDTCREILGPNSNISQLRAHYPHDEINRLSCDEASNYSGIVSVIPLALDLLITYSKGARRLTPTATETSQQTVAKNVGMVADLDKDTSENQSTYKKGTGGFHAGKPAWKPPGNTR